MSTYTIIILNEDLQLRKILNKLKSNMYTLIQSQASECVNEEARRYDMQYHTETRKCISHRRIYANLQLLIISVTGTNGALCILCCVQYTSATKDKKKKYNPKLPDPHLPNTHTHTKRVKVFKISSKVIRVDI